MTELTIFDAFDNETRHLHWNRLARGAAWVNEGKGAEMVVEGAGADQLSVAQVDDYIHLHRKNYLWKPPLRLRTRIRTSHPPAKLFGTAGVGFWNNPFPLWGSRMEVNANWIWCYYASSHSTIALTDGPVNGWKVSIVHGGKGGEALMSLSDRMLKVPFLGKKLSGIRLPAAESSLDRFDFTGWHDFTIEWLPEEITFWFDGQVVQHAHLKMDIPLAFVAWLDNNYASLTPDGQIELGNLAIHHRQSFEMAFVEITQYPPLAG